MVTPRQVTRRQVTRGLAAGVGALALPPAAGAFVPADLTSQDRVFPVEAAGGMVVSREAAATRVGVDILADGGNAVDAAVATAFALAVTLPQAGNLGGGGFAIVHEAGRGSAHAIDFRERAPLAAGRDLFLGADGEVDAELARYSHRSVGVPGSVAGYLALHARWGSLPRRRLIEPAIALATEGVTVTRVLHRNLARRMKRFARWPATMAVVARPDGGPLLPGHLLRQPDLAATLELIAAQGADGFYRGGGRRSSRRGDGSPRRADHPRGSGRLPQR